MNGPGYVEVLESGIVPFSYKFYIHAGQRSQTYIKSSKIEDHSINWWKTPPESPDLNPIENLWHELKEFIRS